MSLKIDLRAKRIVMALLWLASLGVLGLVILAAIEKISSGHGRETFGAFWPFEFNWIGLLVLLSTIVVTLIAALGLRFREHLSWRSLERKYGSRD